MWQVLVIVVASLTGFWSGRLSLRRSSTSRRSKSDPRVSARVLLPINGRQIPAGTGATITSAPLRDQRVYPPFTLAIAATTADHFTINHAYLGDMPLFQLDEPIPAAAFTGGMGFFSATGSAGTDTPLNLIVTNHSDQPHDLMGALIGYRDPP